MWDTKGSKQTHETFDTLIFGEQKVGKLESVPYINMYKKRQKPYITEKQRAKVQNIIIIDHESLEKYRIRQSLGDFYLNQTCNPFLVITQQEKRDLKMTQRDKKNKTLNLIDCLTPINEENKKQKRLALETNKKQFHEFKKNIERVSNKFISSRSKQKDQINKMLNKKVSAVQILRKAERTAEIDPTLLEIETIAAGKEENFFFSKENKLNIFKLARDQQDCINGLDRLRKRHFDETTMVERANPVRIPIFRDLSNVGRTALSKLFSGLEDVQEYVSTDQLAITTKLIQFKDLMSFASNRLSAEYIHKVLTQTYQDRSDSSSTQQIDNIIYRRTNANKICCNRDNTEGHQIQMYRNLPFNEEEKLYKEQLQARVKMILQNQEKRSELLQTTIKDNQAISKLNNKAREMVSDILSSRQKDKSYSKIRVKTENLEEIKKKVRLNKVSSNKVEAIKVRCVNEILVKRNHFSKIEHNFNNKKQNTTIRF